MKIYHKGKVVASSYKQLKRRIMKNIVKAIIVKDDKGKQSVTILDGHEFKAVMPKGTTFKVMANCTVHACKGKTKAVFGADGKKGGSKSVGAGDRICVKFQINVI